MKLQQSLSLSAPAENLRRLLTVRGLFLLVVCATLGFCYWSLHLALPYESILWVISALTLINFTTVIQLKVKIKTSQTAFFGQLLIDVVAITLLLFFTGGADNPFVSYYLVPLCIAAATLPKRFTWPLALIALACYTSLFFWNIPLTDVAPMASEHNGMSHEGMAHAPINHRMSGISIHTAGMWFNFLISAALITFFVVEMAASLRKQDAELAKYREDALHDEQLLAIATLAAGTAHELGTPLSTIKTLIGEMRADNTGNSELDDDLTLLQTQVAHCADTLSHLNERAAQLKDGVVPAIILDTYIHKIIDDWSLLRPEVTVDLTVDSSSPDVACRFDPTIALAITNLLNNAADANPKDININARWTHAEFILSIKDSGPGINDAIQKKLGKAFNSHKGSGRGLGLFLTQATLSRYGGEVTLSNRQSGGTHTQLRLPISPTES